MVLPNYAARRWGGRKQCAANVVLFIIAENPRNCKSSFVLPAVNRSTKNDGGRSGADTQVRPLRFSYKIREQTLPCGPLTLTKSAAP